VGILQRLRGQGASEDRDYLVLINAPPPAPLSVAFSTDSNGLRFFPAFSDEATLLRFEPKGGLTASAPLHVLREMMAASPIPMLIIDPGSPRQRIIRRDEATDK
jgi:hypothetical protein